METTFFYGLISGFALRVEEKRNTKRPGIIHSPDDMPFSDVAKMAYKVR